MKSFISSLTSEIYKSRKTLGFWSAILLPAILCSLVFLTFFFAADKFVSLPGRAIWGIFSSAVLSVMGNLLLPFFVIFLAYSVNSVEHKADTWKTLFSLPLSKWAVYSAKYMYAFLLLLISLLLFALFTIGYGNLLGAIRSHLKFSDYQMGGLLLEIYFKLFLSALGILSIQFLFSLLWSDFLKPMGIGFLLTIIGVVANSVNWSYAYLIPYAQPGMAVKTITGNPNGKNEISISVFTSEVLVSLIVAATVFFVGYYIVQRIRIK